MGSHVSKPDPDSDGLKVIAAGYSRTGTSSMHIALERLLEEPAQHGGAYFFKAGDDSYGRTWNELLQARRRGEQNVVLKHLRSLSRGYAAVADMPWILVVPELLEIYPKAKVVLVVRDPEKWAKSFDGLLDLGAAWYVRYITCIVPCLRWTWLVLMQWKHIADGMCDNQGGDSGRHHGKELVVQHNAMIQNLVHPQQLLIYKLDQGWGPLCDFLEKPVPDEPFPRVNDADAVAAQSAQIVTRVLLLWGLLLGAGLVLSTCIGSSHSKISHFIVRWADTW